MNFTHGVNDTFGSHHFNSTDGYIGSNYYSIAMQDYNTSQISFSNTSSSGYSMSQNSSSSNNMINNSTTITPINYISTLFYNNLINTTTTTITTATATTTTTARTTLMPSTTDGENFMEIYHEIERLVAIIVPIFFGIIAVTGFFGNTLVILVVLFNQQMYSTTNLLIVNLAIADLLFVVFCVPFTATDYVTDFWPFGDIWCRMVQYLIVVTAFASIYTLVLMSIDRFLAVVHPIRSRMLRTEHFTKMAIMMLWAIILTISTPVPLAHGVVYEYDTTTNVTYAMCQFMQNEFVTQSAYQIIFLSCSYLLPLMIISGLYVRMIMRLWRQTSGVRMSVESQRGRKRVTRLVVVVVIAFASLWLPVQLILMLKALDLYHTNTKFKVILQIVAQTLAYTSSCINPLLYAFLSDNFRKAFHKAMHCSKRYQSYTTDLPPPRRTSCGRTSTTGL